MDKLELWTKQGLQQSLPVCGGWAEMKVTLVEHSNVGRLGFRLMLYEILSSQHSRDTIAIIHCSCVSGLLKSILLGFCLLVQHCVCVYLVEVTSWYTLFPSTWNMIQHDSVTGLENKGVKRFIMYMRAYTHSVSHTHTRTHTYKFNLSIDVEDRHKHMFFHVHTHTHTRSKDHHC